MNWTDFRRWKKKSIKNTHGLFCTAANFVAETNNTNGTISFVPSLLLLKKNQFLIRLMEYIQAKFVTD